MIWGTTHFIASPKGERFFPFEGGAGGWQVKVNYFNSY
jgi:hypothetical protein